MTSFRKAVGMPVASLAEGAFVGKLDDFLFDLESGRIYGYRLKQGVFSKVGGVSAEHLVRLGKDLVFVTGEEAVEWSGVPKGLPDGRAWATEYRGKRVMSRRGADLGTVDDFLFEAAPPRVGALVLDGGRVAPWGDRVAVGRDAVILDDATVAEAPPPEAEETNDWWKRMRGLFDGER